MIFYIGAHPKLAVTIPEGCAVGEDRELKSASAMSWVNSPSDDKPKSPIAFAKTAQKWKEHPEDGNESSDTEFVPAKNPNARTDDEPMDIFDENGNEIIAETEEGTRIVSSTFLPRFISD